MQFNDLIMDLEFNYGIAEFKIHDELFELWKMKSGGPKLDGG